MMSEIVEIYERLEILRKSLNEVITFVNFYLIEIRGHPVNVYGLTKINDNWEKEK